MELLAPAGNIEGFKAVLAQKPDVIYLGAGDLNARSAEAQFALEDLPELVDLARQAGSKIHFTLNVMIKDSELDRALEIAKIALDAGVAALIVQDKGLMRALRQAYPHCIIHASTQCSVGTKEQIDELKDLQVQRVVFARELSLEQIAELTAYAHASGLEVEVFTHGATCMSVSGQCHLSFCRGGRSANRGACAQPCRLDYQLRQNQNGSDRLIRDWAAWLSPRDLSYFPYLQELVDIGIDSLKIEGRLRSSEYQAQVTAIFMQALTEIEQGLPADRIFTAERERNLEIAFNRGGAFQSAFLQDNRGADFLSAEQVGHQGYYLGEVKRVKAQRGILSYLPQEKDYLPPVGGQINLKDRSGATVATAPVGVVRRGGADHNSSKKEKYGKAKTENRDKASRNQANHNSKAQITYRDNTSRNQAGHNGEVELQGFHPRVLQKLRLPLSVWLQKQSQVTDQLERAAQPAIKEPIHMVLRKDQTAAKDGRLVYLLDISNGSRKFTFSSAKLEPQPQVLDRPLDADRIKQQLAKLGNTPFALEHLEIDLNLEECPAWRVSDLNNFRREAIAKFLSAEEQIDLSGVSLTPKHQAEPTSIRDIIYLPNYQASDNLQGLAGQEGELVVLPLEELYLSYKRDPQLSGIKAALGQAKPGAYLAPLGAWSCDQNRDAAIKILQEQGLHALVSSTSGSRELVETIWPEAKHSEQLPLELFLWQGDQVSNQGSFEFFKDRGYQGLMISPELSFKDQEALAAACLQENTKPIIFCYGPLEAMFTRFCPLGFSRGVDACGICRKQKGFRLEDRDGHPFQLTPLAYADCSLQVWNGSPVRQDTKLNCLRGFNFIEESPAEMRAILAAYAQDSE
ncbi:MAG: U32 family peptidase [Eubacteriales bacterium]|nr:U32 family peptidase [Eubacteriales bacterium]